MSLFTGAGGLDIGMERAGFDPVIALDIDPRCIDALRCNRETGIPIPGRAGRCYLDHARIEGTDVREVGGPWLETVACGRIDCLYGGPPCQAFSSSGRMRSIADPRGALVLEFVRLVAEARPRTFLFENVRGLVTARDASGEPGGVLKMLLERFEAAGYGVAVSLLNAADLGAFQRRVRCFIVGVDAGSPPPFPQPTHARRGDGGRRPWRTLAEFLASRPYDDGAGWTRPTARLAALLAGMPCGSGLKSRGIVETTRPGGHWGYRQGTFVADPALPARTVTGSSGQDWVRLPDGSLRRLTFAEVAALQGFPAAWQFSGSVAQRYQQVGNAVPAIFGHAIGACLRHYLDHYPAGSPPVSRVPDARIDGCIRSTRRDSQRNRESRIARVPAR